VIRTDINVATLRSEHTHFTDLLLARAYNKIIFMLSCQFISSIHTIIFAYQHTWGRGQYTWCPRKNPIVVSAQNIPPPPGCTLRHQLFIVYETVRKGHCTLNTATGLLKRDNSHNKTMNALMLLAYFYIQLRRTMCENTRVLISPWPDQEGNTLQSLHFMELGGSLPHSQEYTTCPYPSQINPFLCPSHC